MLPKRKVRTAVVKRVGARFGVALFPGRSSHAVFIANHMHTMDLEVPLLHIRTPIRQPMARKYDIFLDWL